VVNQIFFKDVHWGKKVKKTMLYSKHKLLNIPDLIKL